MSFNMGGPHHTPYWILVSDTTVGPAVTSVSFTSLDLDAASAFLIIASIKNGSAAGNTEIYLEYNGDTTLTNYYSQFLTTTAAGGGVAAGRVNTPNIITIATKAVGVTGYFHGVIMRDADGYTRCNSTGCRGAASGIRILNKAHIWTTTNNITSLQLVASRASGIDAGSHILLFKAV